MREKILASNPGEARAQNHLAYALRAIALLRRKTADLAGARRDYLRAHALYTDLRARGYGGANVRSEIGVTQLELGKLSEEEGRMAEACRWYRESATVYGELRPGRAPAQSPERSRDGPPRGRGLRPLITTVGWSGSFRDPLRLPRPLRSTSGTRRGPSSARRSGSA